MTTGKIVALTIGTFVGKVMSLLFKMLSRLVVAFLPRRMDVGQSLLSGLVAHPSPFWWNLIQISLIPLSFSFYKM